MFWVVAFIEAYNLFVLASSACIWYFEKATFETVTKPINRSYFRGIRFHMGSLAFGSLIVSLLRIAVAMCEYIKIQIEASQGLMERASGVYTCCITCCECCLVACLKCVEFINKHAYIQVLLVIINLDCIRRK